MDNVSFFSHTHTHRESITTIPTTTTIHLLVYYHHSNNLICLLSSDTSTALQCYSDALHSTLGCRFGSDHSGQIRARGLGFKKPPP